MTRPAVAVISVGANNSFGHPTPPTLDRLAAITDNVYRTDLSGTIEIITDGEKLWVRTQR